MGGVAGCWLPWLWSQIKSFWEAKGHRPDQGRRSPAEFTRPPSVSAGAHPGDQELAVWTLAGAAETGQEGGGGWRSWGTSAGGPGLGRGSLPGDPYPHFCPDVEGVPPPSPRAPGGRTHSPKENLWGSPGAMPFTGGPVTFVRMTCGSPRDRGRTSPSHPDGKTKASCLYRPEMSWDWDPQAGPLAPC